MYKGIQIVSPPVPYVFQQGVLLLKSCNTHVYNPSSIPMVAKLWHACPTVLFAITESSKRFDISVHSACVALRFGLV